MSLLNANAYSYLSLKVISKISLRLGSTVIDFSMRGSSVTLNADSIGEVKVIWSVVAEILMLIVLGAIELAP